ncbi:MAG: Gfo/Idh/MocA family protein [bacterium]
MINVCVAGLGHWGPNLARNIAQSNQARLCAICDQDRERLKQVGQQYPAAEQHADFDAVCGDPDVDAVMIATPVHTHFGLAAAALEAGKHVFVEKPLAQRSDQCESLIDLSERQGLILMVGHVFLYNAAVRKVKEYIESGELGQIYYIYSQRLNLGIIRQDVNALWNFAPHDLSILSYWLEAMPTQVRAQGYPFVQDEIEDVVFMTVDFPHGVGASVHISWLDPNKVRRMTVVGSEKMVVYDDVSSDSKITVYDKGVTRAFGEAPSLGDYQSFGEFQLLIRAGDVVIPRLDFPEPLSVECAHFLECVRTGQSPLTDGAHALKVVRVLEAAQRSLEQDGVPERVVER